MNTRLHNDYEGDCAGIVQAIVQAARAHVMIAPMRHR